MFARLAVWSASAASWLVDVEIVAVAPSVHGQCGTVRLVRSLSGLMNAFFGRVVGRILFAMEVGPTSEDSIGFPALSLFSPELAACERASA